MKKQLLLILLVASASLCQAQNPILFGMTSGGGIIDSGIIFNYNTSVNTETITHNFGSNSTDGTNPYGSLIQANNGLLYGMTSSGGINYYGGTIFNYNITTSKETVLYNFGNKTNGYLPYGSLIQASNGLLYGMTSDGGTNETGDIFSYNIATGQTTELYDFSFYTGGNQPIASLIQANDGLLYGMTMYGGDNGLGNIFNYNISTGTETDLYDFGKDSDGQLPFGSLIQASNGLLYGLTGWGGANGYGTIFNYNTLTNTETIIYNFEKGTDG